MASPTSRAAYACLVTGTLILGGVVTAGPTSVGEAIEAGPRAWWEGHTESHPVSPFHQVLDGCVNLYNQWPYVTINPDECV